MKPNYQNETTYGALCEVAGQSIVECRLSGAEIATVLVCQPRVSLEQATCENGEVRYSGKLLLSFVYENANGEICRAERGAEFFHKAEHPMIAPAFTAVGGLKTQNVKLRREGGQLIAACIVEGAFSVFGERRHTYLAGGEGLLTQKKAQGFVSRYVAFASVEDEDEFECDYAQDILLHTETVSVTAVRANVGAVDVDGELCMHFCVLRADGSLCSYERLIPVKAQALIDNAGVDSTATAKLEVLSTQVEAATDEERGKSKIVLAYRLALTVWVEERVDTEVCVDAYSTARETELKFEKVVGRCAMKEKIVTERIHGTPIFDGSIEGQNAITVVAPTVNVSLQCAERGWEAQGLIEGKALLKKEDGYACADVSLPFLFPVEIDGSSVDVEGCVYGFGIRIRASGEVEGEASIKLRITPYKDCETVYLAEVTEGEEKQASTCAVSVYMPTRGDDLWTTAKRLSLSPDELRAANPALTFPLKGDERIFVYRQKKENLQK